MELRKLNPQARTVEGIVAPYNEITLYAGDPHGERIMRHAFARSIERRGTRIPLCRNHDQEKPVGMSREWIDGEEGLVGVFEFRNNEHGQQALADVEEGYLQAMSVGFLPVDRKRNRDDNVMEVREGRLIEVSLCLAGAYEGAEVMAARMAQQARELFAPFENRPVLPVPFVAPWL